MFEIFDNIAQASFVFKDFNLIYANNAACFLLDSYERSLIGLRFNSIFENSEEFLNDLPFDSETKMILKFKKGNEEKFRIKAVDECEGRFVIVQCVAPAKGEKEEYNFNKIIAPRAVYDPISAGKLNIMDYEISDKYLKVQEELNKLEKNPTSSASAREISSLLWEMIDEFRKFAAELIDADIKYLMLNSAFSVNRLLSKIASRMNNVFKLENMRPEIVYEAPTGQDSIIFGDYMKIGSSIITLITMLTNIISKKNKKGKVEIELTRDDKFCYINISSKTATITRETYDIIVNQGTEIISLNRYKTDKMVLNIHAVSAYVELNGGELSIKRDKKEGTHISVKFPLVKRKFTLKEFALSEDMYIDEIISKIIYYVLNNM